MKKRFSIFDFKLFKYLRRLVGNEYPDSKSKSKKNKVVVEDNLRWQDDGGPVVEVAKPAEADENDSFKKESGKTA